ncbi:MAG: FtsW/RodA/SpoVE family cell cycle protein, partial [Patescibacteria group bacterium]
MLNKIFVYLKNFDWILFFAVLLLVSVGLIEIYSIALSRESIDLLNFKKQIFFVILGIFLLFLFALIDFNYLKGLSNYLYLGGILALIAILFFGETIRGSRSWFYFGSFGFQPVEFIKIILLIFLARFFSGYSVRIKTIKHFVVSGLSVLIFVVLVLAQPDFGSALILLLAWLAVLLITGFSKKYFFIIALILIILFTSAWLFFFKDYQKERIITFINPSYDYLDQGYNATQAMIAVGAGGLTGRGIGFGSQSQLKFLPEAQNDFIFAVIAEELGLLGVGLIIIFFSVFYYRCIVIIKRINNDFAIFLLLGAMGLIFIEMFINIGMNIGILPVIGISL